MRRFMGKCTRMVSVRTLIVLQEIYVKVRYIELFDKALLFFVSITGWRFFGPDTEKSPLSPRGHSGKNKHSRKYGKGGGSLHVIVGI